MYNQKGSLALSLIIIGLLLLSIPAGVYLAQHPQILKTRANVCTEPCGTEPKCDREPQEFCEGTKQECDGTKLVCDGPPTCRSCAGEQADDAGCDGDPEHEDICDGPPQCHEEPDCKDVPDCRIEEVDVNCREEPKYCEVECPPEPVDVVEENEEDDNPIQDAVEDAGGAVGICKWEFDHNECTGCREARRVERNSCTGDTDIKAYGVEDEECRGPDWCGQQSTGGNVDTNQGQTQCRDPNQFPDDYNEFAYCAGCEQEIWRCPGTNQTHNFGDTSDHRCTGPQYCGGAQQDDVSDDQINDSGNVGVGVQNQLTDEQCRANFNNGQPIYYCDGARCIARTQAVDRNNPTQCIDIYPDADSLSSCPNSCQNNTVISPQEQSRQSQQQSQREILQQEEQQTPTTSQPETGPGTSQSTISNQNTTTQTGQSCNDDTDFTEFVGCNTRECGKEIWRCPQTGQIRDDFDSPEDGGCRTEGMNPACRPVRVESRIPTRPVTSTVGTKTTTVPVKKEVICEARAYCNDKWDPENGENLLDGTAIMGWFREDGSGTKDCPPNEQVYAPQHCPPGGYPGLSVLTGQTKITEGTSLVQVIEKTAAICTYQQDSIEYDCSRGFRCWNDFYADSTTFCQWKPEEPHFHCDADETCFTEEDKAKLRAAEAAIGITNYNGESICQDINYCDADYSMVITNTCFTQADAIRVVNHPSCLPADLQTVDPNVRLQHQILADQDAKKLAKEEARRQGTLGLARVIGGASDFLRDGLGGFWQDISGQSEKSKLCAQYNDPFDEKSKVPIEEWPKECQPLISRQTISNLWGSFLTDRQIEQEQFANIPSQCIEYIDPAAGYIFTKTDGECAIYAKGPPENQLPTKDKIDLAIQKSLVAKTNRNEEGAIIPDINEGLKLYGIDLYDPRVQGNIGERPDQSLSAVMTRVKVEEIAANMGVEMGQYEKWSDFQRKAFFEQVSRVHINVAKATVEALIYPVTAHETKNAAEVFCVETLGRGCILKPDAPKSYQQLTTDDLTKLNELLVQQPGYREFQPPAPEIMTQYFQLLNAQRGSIGAQILNGLLDDQAITNSLNNMPGSNVKVSVEEVANIKLAYQAYGNASNFIRTRTEEGQYLQKAEETYNSELVLALATSAIDPLAVPVGIAKGVLIGGKLTKGAAEKLAIKWGARTDQVVDIATRALQKEVRGEVLSQAERGAIAQVADAQRAVDLEDLASRQAGEAAPSASIVDEASPQGATAKCRDGSFSFSQSRSGACSSHGGVERFLANLTDEITPLPQVADDLAPLADDVLVESADEALERELAEALPPQITSDDPAVRGALQEMIDNSQNGAAHLPGGDSLDTTAVVIPDAGAVAVAPAPENPVEAARGAAESFTDRVVSTANQVQDRFDQLLGRARQTDQAGDQTVQVLAGGTRDVPLEDVGRALDDAARRIDGEPEQAAAAIVNQARTNADAALNRNVRVEVDSQGNIATQRGGRSVEAEIENGRITEIRTSDQDLANKVADEVGGRQGGVRPDVVVEEPLILVPEGRETVQIGFRQRLEEATGGFYVQSMVAGDGGERATGWIFMTQDGRYLKFGDPGKENHLKITVKVETDPGSGKIVIREVSMPPTMAPELRDRVVSDLGALNNGQPLVSQVPGFVPEPLKPAAEVVANSVNGVTEGVKKVVNQARETVDQVIHPPEILKLGNFEVPADEWGEITLNEWIQLARGHSDVHGENVLARISSLLSDKTRAATRIDDTSLTVSQRIELLRNELDNLSIQEKAAIGRSSFNDPTLSQVNFKPSELSSATSIRAEIRQALQEVDNLEQVTLTLFDDSSQLISIRRGGEDFIVRLEDLKVSRDQVASRLNSAPDFIPPTEGIFLSGDNLDNKVLFLSRKIDIDLTLASNEEIIALSRKMGELGFVPDINLGNFVKDKQGKVWYVDQDFLHHVVRSETYNASEVSNKALEEAIKNRLLTENLTSEIAQIPKSPCGVNSGGPCPFPTLSSNRAVATGQRAINQAAATLNSVLERAKQVIKREPSLSPGQLPVVDPLQGSGLARMSAQAKREYQFLDQPEYQVTLSTGERYTLANKAIQESEDRIILPIRREDGTVMMVYSSKSRGGFDHFNGIAAYVNQEGTKITDQLWFVKPSEGKEIAHLPFEFDRAIKSALHDGLIAVNMKNDTALAKIIDKDFGLAFRPPGYDFIRGADGLPINPKVSIDDLKKVKEEAVAIADKKLEAYQANIYKVKADGTRELVSLEEHIFDEDLVEGAQSVIRDIDFNRPSSVVYSGEDKVDVYFVGSIYEIKVTFFLNPGSSPRVFSDTPGSELVDLEAFADFTVKLRADPNGVVVNMPFIVRASEVDAIIAKYSKDPVFAARYKDRLERSNLKDSAVEAYPGWKDVYDQISDSDIGKQVEAIYSEFAARQKSDGFLRVGELEGRRDELVESIRAKIDPGTSNTGTSGFSGSASDLAALQSRIDNQNYNVSLNVANPTKPLRSNAFDPKLADEWVKAHPVELQPTAQAIVNSTRHVSQEEFEVGLRRSVESFNEILPPSENYAVFVESTKSNQWAAELAMPNVNHLPSQVYEISSLDNIANIESTTFVFFEDALYSGQQMSLITEKITQKLISQKVDPKDIKFIVVAPYATQFAEQQVRAVSRFGAQVIFAEHEVMKGVRDLITDPNILENINKMYGFGGLLADEKPLIYFDHKIPDALSTLEQVYKDGQVRGIDGRVLDRKPFVPETETPYSRPTSELSNAIEVNDIDSNLGEGGLPPCPISFNLIPVVYAQSVPCPFPNLVPGPLGEVQKGVNRTLKAVTDLVGAKDGILSRIIPQHVLDPKRISDIEYQLAIQINNNQEISRFLSGGMTEVIEADGRRRLKPITSVTTRLAFDENGNLVNPPGRYNVEVSWSKTSGGKAGKLAAEGISIPKDLPENLEADLRAAITNSNPSVRKADGTEGKSLLHVSKLDPCPIGFQIIPVAYAQGTNPCTSFLDPPLARDASTDNLPRTNTFTASDGTIHSEREGLVDLYKKLAEYKEVARERGLDKTVKEIEDLEQKLVFLGEPEFSNGVNFIANRVISHAELAKRVIFYVPYLETNSGSEIFIADKVLEQISRSRPDLKGKIYVSTSPSEVITTLENIGNNSKIIIADDVSVSGTQLLNHVADVARPLMDKGVGVDEIQNMMELDLIAAGKDKILLRITPGQIIEVPLYPHYKLPTNDLLERGGVRVTSIWSSTDYNFDTTLDNILKALRINALQNGLPNTFEKPLLSQLKQPYKHLQDRYQFEPTFLAKWKQTLEEYRVASLAPCPLGFNLIPVAFAQGEAPCPFPNPGSGVIGGAQKVVNRATSIVDTGLNRIRSLLPFLGKNDEVVSKGISVVIEGGTEIAESIAIKEQLSSVGRTASSMNNLLHQQAGLSPYGELNADFVRFRARTGNKLLLGTIHENTLAERALIDAFVEDVVKQDIKVVYVESGGLTKKDNLVQWLVENGYIVSEKASTGGELKYVTKSLVERGIKVVNMDMVFNPTALGYAVQRFGVEKTVRDLYWALDILNFSKDTLDSTKQPEIIVRLLSESKVSIDERQVLGIINRKPISDADFFTDAVREEYMVSFITGERYAVAAHTAHTTALAERLFGSQELEDVRFFVDSDKVGRVVNQSRLSMGTEINPKDFLSLLRERNPQYDYGEYTEDQLRKAIEWAEGTNRDPLTLNPAQIELAQITSVDESLALVKAPQILIDQRYKTLLDKAESLDPVLLPTVPTYYHATSDLETAESIFQDGLYASTTDGLNAVAISLRNSNSDLSLQQQADILDANIKLLSDTHKGFNFAVIVRLPTSDPKQYIEKLPQSVGYPRSYDGVVPSRYIYGVLNVDTGKFIPNPKYKISYINNLIYPFLVLTKMGAFNEGNRFVLYRLG